MLPHAYEFHWDLGHVVFLGIFYSVVGVVAVSLAVALVRRYLDLRRWRTEVIDWHETFADLPRERRRCRHELDGTLEHRICEHGFACSTCAEHARLGQRSRADTVDEPVSVGMELSTERYYHRGHLWVEPEGEGIWRVGWDEFAHRCCGDAAELELPEPGRRVGLGSRVLTARRGPLEARFPSPLAGTVLDAAPDGAGWLFRLRTDRAGGPPEDLLNRDEARRWLLRELEWLQKQLGADPATAIADGGAPVSDLVAACPGADWDTIWGQICLDC